MHNILAKEGSILQNIAHAADMESLPVNLNLDLLYVPAKAQRYML
jgi:hypothetical protein